jgi:hypothetical protein
MSKDKLRELLSQLWLQDISADEAFDELEDLINHIKRLEEAGDVLCAAAAFMGWHMEIEKWNEAKEAKEAKL